MLTYLLYCHFLLPSFKGSHLLTYNVQSDSAKVIMQIKSMETGLNNLLYYGDKNNYFKKLLRGKINYYMKTTDVLVLQSSDKKEICSADLMSDGDNTDFRQFTVEKKEKRYTKIKTAPFKKIISNSGIALGITKSRFLKIKNITLYNKNILADGATIFYYRIYDSLNRYSDIFTAQHYNRPYYICIYKFNRFNKLIKFGFGMVPRYEEWKGDE